MSFLFLTCPSNTNISSNFIRVICNSLVLPKGDQLLSAPFMIIPFIGSCYRKEGKQFPLCVALCFEIVISYCFQKNSWELFLFSCETSQTLFLSYSPQKKLKQSPAFLLSRVSHCHTPYLRSSFFQFPSCTCHIPLHNLPFRASSSDLLAPRPLRLSQSLT